MPFITHTDINYSVTDTITDLGNFILNQKFYAGIGKATSWSEGEGTAVKDFNPPLPFYHQEDLYEPLLFKQVKLVAPLLAETYIADSKLILKTIKYKDYDLKESQNLLILNKERLFNFEDKPNNLNLAIKSIYLELEIDYSDLAELDVQEIREIGIYSLSPTDELIKVNYLPEEFTWSKELMLLSYFSPRVINPNKSLVFKFIIDLPQTFEVIY